MQQPDLPIAVQSSISTRKYVVEKALYVLSFVGLLCVVPLPFFIFSLPLALGLTALFGLFLFLIARYAWESMLEAKLVKADSLPVFEVTGDGIAGSIALLEGRRRDRMRRQRSARFTLSWDEINEVAFHDGRASSSGASTPAYLVIVPRGEFARENYFYVLRAPLGGSEQAIADAFRSHNIKVELEGRIRCEDHLRQSKTLSADRDISE